MPIIDKFSMLLIVGAAARYAHAQSRDGVSEATASAGARLACCESEIIKGGWRSRRGPIVWR